MHVAYVITRSDALGGASVHVRDMAVALAQRGHKATVLIGGTGGEVVDRLRASGVPYRLVPALGRSIHPLRDAAAVLALRSQLKQLVPDLVSTHTAKAGLTGRLAAASLGIPVLYTPHGWAISDRISRLSGRLFAIAERSAAPLSARIVNVCEAERTLALAHQIAQPGLLDVIHNGVIDTPPSLRANPSLNPPRLTMVARFEAPKDHSTLLLALATLKTLPWRLELAGSGPLEAAVRAQVNQLGLTGRVHFHGASQNVADLLAASQIFVLSSRSEGFPRSILEAMRAGLPVVASDAGGSCEAVANGKSGIIVPRANVPLMANALELLLTSSALRQRFGTSSRQRYESHFTFDHMFDQTFALYQSVLSGNATEPAEPALAGAPLRRNF
jgi:glycosyltransferase involved in cell wall biosynthesis